MLNIIDKAKKGAAADSAYGVEKAADFYYLGNVGNSNFAETTFTYNGTVCTSNLDSNVKLDIGGTVPTSGTIIVRRNGKVEVSNLVINGYNCTKTNEVYNCGGEVVEPEPITYTSYNIGQAINFNPVDNTICTNPVSETGTKTGCMRWYVIEDSSSENDSIKVILDHNTTAQVAWNSNNMNISMGELATQLATDTSGWISSLNAHVPSGQEIATAVEYESFNAGEDYWYFETQSKILPEPYVGTYGWLYDRTYNCTSYGCTTLDNSTNGYWTSTAHSGGSSRALIVYFYGRLDGSYVASTNYGLRPVITINKANL